jgi:NADH-quinone oxidoreductase subunit J
VETLIFGVCGTVAVAAALAVILLQDVVRSALSLIVALGALAVLFAQLESPFLAALQIVLYAGAVMMLFLFVVMLLRRDRPPQDEAPRLRRQFAALLAVFLWGLLTLALSGAAPAAAVVGGGGLGLAEMSRVLFQKYLYPFELISLLILTAIVGVVVLGKRRF